ncbi:MAG: type IV pilus assembly protein PilM [Actinomycetota bacterium]
MAKIRDSIGLDIGTSGVRAAHISLAKHPATLENFGQVSLPTGLVRDGEILDVDQVSKAISELWRRAGFKKKLVSLGVANQKTVARPIDLPHMSEEELRGALQFQIQEYIPMPIEDAVVDFQVLDEFVTENNERMMRVLLVAAQKDMVNSCVAAVEKAGLTLAAIDFIPLTLVRSLGDSADALARGSGTGEAIIDVGAGVTKIVVHEAGVPRFVRVLSIGGNDLTESVAAALAISLEEAESLKQRLGLPFGPVAPPAPPAPSAGTPGVDPVTGAPAPAGAPSMPQTPGAPAPSVIPGASMQEQNAARILDQRATAFVDEVRGSLDYYLAGAEGRISRVVLCGGGAKLTNLSTRLANSLRLPVETGRPLQKMRVGKTGLTEAQLADAEPLMAAALGAALGAEG